MEHYDNIKAQVAKAASASGAEVVSYTFGYLEGAGNRSTAEGTTNGVSYHSMTESKVKFAKFVKAAAVSMATPEYVELYKFLLKCFTDADEDFSGLIDADEFSLMIEVAASAPRKFGFAPATSEIYGDKKGMEAARKKMFKTMDAAGKGEIAFDVWLHFCYDHIRKKASNLEVPESDDISRDKDSFVNFVKSAVDSKTSCAYKELYHFLLKCFTEADTDHDGTIGAYEFDKLIQAAAEAPRRFGMAPTEAQMYNSYDERFAARTKMFNAMANGKKQIAFDQWLNFAYKHIIEKVQGLRV